MSVLERYLHRNPELLKSVWLEMSPARLIIMPVILILLVLLSTASGDDIFLTYTRLMGSIKGFMMVVLLIYGSWQAAQSYLTEVNDNTWIFQRMSSIPPWRMMIGKLFGGTMYSWYGGILGAVAYMVAASQAPAQAFEKQIVATPLLDVCAIFLTAILAHTCTLLVAFQVAERSPLKSRLNSFFAIGIGGACWVLTSFYQNVPLVWWFRDFVHTDFYLCTVLFFAGLTLLGLHSRVRQELQHRTTPWVLLVFLISVAVFLTGMNVRDPESLAHTIPFTICVLGLLTVLFVGAEATDVSRLRHLINLAGEGRWQRILELTPQWMVAFAVFSVATVAVAVVSPLLHTDFSTNIVRGLGESVEFQPGKLWFLVLRDIGLVLWLSSALKRRHADLIICAIMLILYIFVPLIFTAAQWHVAAGSLWPLGYSEGINLPSYALVVLQTGAVLFGFWNHARGKLARAIA